MDFEKKKGKNIILIVEDSPDDIFLIRRALARARVVNPIYFLKNGEEAISYLSGKGEFSDREKYPLPILILLDLRLPRVSGFELIKWIRSQKKPISLIPLVVFTISSQDHDINKAYELGANSYIVKPFYMRGLIEVVKGLELYWVFLNNPPQYFLEVKENENKKS